MTAKRTHAFKEMVDSVGVGGRSVTPKSWAVAWCGRTFRMDDEQLVNRWDRTTCRVCHNARGHELGIPSSDLVPLSELDPSPRPALRLIKGGKA